MSAATDRARSAYRAGFTLLLAAAVWEAIARSGMFPAALLPTLPRVASTFIDLLLDGTLLEHAFFTMYRVPSRALPRSQRTPRQLQGWTLARSLHPFREFPRP